MNKIYFQASAIYYHLYMLIKFDNLGREFLRYYKENMRGTETGHVEIIFI